MMSVNYDMALSSLNTAPRNRAYAFAVRFGMPERVAAVPLSKTHHRGVDRSGRELAPGEWRSLHRGSRSREGRGDHMPGAPTQPEARHRLAAC